MDPGSKVTYNGVQIGRVADIDEIERDGKPAAKFTLDVYPKYLHADPGQRERRNHGHHGVRREVRVADGAGNPSPQRITPQTVIDARSVTTEINTLFQTITSIAEKVDPVKLNLTLSAAAQALSRAGRQVRAVDRQRQRDPRRRQPADAADPPRHPAVGGAGRHLRQRRAGPVRLPQQRGDHGAHDQPAAEGSGPGAAGGGRVRQHRRRHLQARRAVPGPRRAKTWCRRPSCWTPTARDCSAPSATTTTSNPRSPRSPAATATRCSRHRAVLRAGLL